MWAADPYAEGVWSGAVIPNTAPPGQTLPPPVPGGTAVYTTSVQQGAQPWALGGWAGGINPQSILSGGIVVVPQPDTGVMQVCAWWPNATALDITRTGPDGTPQAVRGGYPATPTAPTRTNVATNPSARAGLNGYVPGTGNPALTTITRTDDGDTAWRATIAAAGTNEVVIPQALYGGRRATVALDLQFSARPSSLTITAGWNDWQGNALTASVATISADAINASVSQFGRQVAVLTPPPGAVVCSTVKVTAGGLPAGARMDGSRVLIEQGASDGSYVDGDVLGGQWLGVAELSASLAAPVYTLDDGECPLDELVAYHVYYPWIIGGAASAPPTVLPSNEQSWLTHPSAPGAPVAISPTVVPTRTYALAQGVFPVLGRVDPVVVSGTVRAAPSGTLALDCATFAERDALLALLSDGQPVLVRAPGDYGWGDAQWLALADITEDPGGRPAWSQTRTLSATFQVVTAPAAANLVAP